MALDDDNKTQLNDTEQSSEEMQPWDSDLPVDPDAESTNAEAVKGMDKKKVVGLCVVVGLVVLAAILVFSLSKKSDQSSAPTEPPLTAEAPPQPSPKPQAPPSDQPATPQNPPAVNPNSVVDDSGSLARPGDQDWVKGITKPLPIPDGLKATPGLPGSDAPQVRVVQEAVGATAPANSKQAAMTRLWQDGAQAKHRGDTAAARKAWERILELDPGHPGIQEAIDQLPR